MLQQQTKLKMKKTNLLAPMLMIFLLCLIFTSTLLVQGTALVADDDGRDVRIEVSEEKDEAIIESESKLDGSKNEFKIFASTSDEGIEVKLEYRDNIGAQETDLEFKVNIYELIEYTDVNDDGVYNAPEEIIKTVSLNDFEDIVYSNGTTEKEDTTFHNITISTTDGTDGVFTCKVYAVGEFATIDGTEVTPTEIKIDFEIHGFNYDDDDSDLALNIRVESTGESEIVPVPETDEVEVDVTLDGFAGFFSWSENAKVDGKEVKVNNSLVDEDVGDGTDLKIYLNYPRGIDIIHDPKMGIADAPTASIPSEIVSNLLAILELSREGYLASMAAFTLLVMSGVILYHRKRR